MRQFHAELRVFLKTLAVEHTEMKNAKNMEFLETKIEQS